MEFEKEFVEETVSNVYQEITERLTGFHLEQVPIRKKRVEGPMSAVIISKGIFKSKVVCVFPKKFMLAVTDALGGNEELSEDDRALYFKEYLNICFGRIISCFNNRLERASRFVIPVLLQGTYKETGIVTYKNQAEMHFKGEYGLIKINICYDVLPEHASN